MTNFMRSIWFNKLSRQLYTSLPLPGPVKQRLKEIYLRRPGAWRKPLTIALDRETLPLIVASAKQFDSADPWVLVVDSSVSLPAQDSFSIRMLAILHFLQEMGFRITFISDSKNYSPHYQEALGKNGIDVLHGFKAARSHLVATGGKYHFVLLSGPEVAFRYSPYVRAYALYSKVIYDTADLHWVSFEREMRISGDRSLLDVVGQFRRIELYNTACADLVFATTDEEKNRLLVEQPETKVTVLPNTHETLPPKTPFSQRRGLLFIGSFWHKADEDAVTFFVQNILPRITEKIPDLVVYIIGSNMPRSVESLSSVNVEPLGFVPEVVPYFESCRIFVAPLRFGAEMKSKVGQSMSHGLPVVSTHIGAEGMSLQHGKHLLIADETGDFADQVVRLYNDEALWRRLSAEALAHLDANYSPAAARKRMIDSFTQSQN